MEDSRQDDVSPKQELTKPSVEDVLASGMLGTALAGGTFGILWVGVSFLYIPTEMLYFAILALSLILAFIAGIIMAGIACIIVSIVFMLFHWSVDSSFGPRLALSLIGSGSGFLATAQLSGLFDSESAVDLAFLPRAISIVGAMFLGHVGAIWAARKQNPGQLKTLEAASFNFRFQIRHLMVVTAWAAGFSWLAAQFGTHILVTLMIGLTCQVMIAGCDYLWCRALYPAPPAPNDFSGSH